MAQITLLKSSALQYLLDLISSVADAITGEGNARAAGLSRAGVIPVSITGTTVAGNETTFSATIDPVLATQGVFIASGSSVELILPNDPITTTGNVYLHVGGDQKRTIMDELNDFPVPVEQLGAKRGLILKRRGGNWVIQTGASNGRLNQETANRKAMVNAAGVIPLSNAVSVVSEDKSETLITATVQSGAASLGAAIAGGSTVRVVLPSPLIGLLKMKVGDDDERSILSETGSVRLSGDDLTEGASIFMDRRAGNWVVISGAVGTDEFKDLAVRNQVLARDAAIIPTEVASGSTGDAILLASAPSFSASNIEVPVQTKFTKMEYRPVETNQSENPTITIDGEGPYAVRGQDGEAWPAEGFVVGRHYFLHRLGQTVRVMFPGGSDEAVLVNDDPFNTDAGFQCEDLLGNISFRHDASGTHLAGLQGTVEDNLTLFRVPTVAPSLHEGGLDILRSYDVTDEAKNALSKGQLARGGRAAPMPTFIMPQPMEWGKQWLETQRVTITPDSPRFSPDPIYQNNVGFNEFVHPHVMHFPHGFMGYEYLLCVNPYRGGAGPSEALENPVIYGAHDMKGPWHRFEHFENPLADSTNYADSRTFLSDNTWIYDPTTGELMCVYRRTRMADGITSLEYRSTLDGKTWSPRRVLYPGGPGMATMTSLMLAYDPAAKLWHIIYSDDYVFMRSTKRDIRNINEPWSEPVTTGVTGWHGECRIIGSRLYLFTCNTNHAPGFKIHRSLPGDWSTFELVRENFIDNAEFVAEYGSALTYKNTLVPHLYEDGTAQMKCLIQCRPSQTQWWLFYGETERQPIVDV